MSSPSAGGRIVTTLAGNFGRLWKAGHETFTPESRRIISVSGAGATQYLQGLVTCDLMNPPPPPREEEADDHHRESGDKPESLPGGVEFSDRLRAACFLDSKGRILTDSLLWKVDETQYYLDVPGSTADPLLGHLRQFILRRTKVKVRDASSTMASHVVFGTLNAHGTPDGFMAGVDPRHPSLGMRVLSLEGGGGENDTGRFARMMSSRFPDSPGTYSLLRRLAGVAEGHELAGRVAGETNQEFLNAVSFSKGCYLGQELTARVQYTGAIRKRVMPLMMVHPNMQVPRPWLVASQVQAKVKFPPLQQEDRQGAETDGDDADADADADAAPESESPRLPRLSPSAVGSMVAMMSGSPLPIADGGDGEGSDTSAARAGLEELQKQSEALFEELQSYKAGDKIYDTKDGKTIGQVVAAPQEGTNVLLAQMRLDRVGLMRDEKGSPWSYTNKVTIGGDEGGGGSSPLRYLPYLPLWWPPIDPETGKARQK
jgi:folate-binding protein YgfZ